MTNERSSAYIEIATNAASFAAQHYQQINGNAVMAILAYIHKEAAHLDTEDSVVVAGRAFDIFAAAVAAGD